MAVVATGQRRNLLHGLKIREHLIIRTGYARVNAIVRIEKMINDLPSSDDPDAAQKFATLEQALNASRPHLGDLYDAYSTTLSDMKPEYING